MWNLEVYYTLPVCPSLIRYSTELQRKKKKYAIFLYYAVFKMQQVVVVFLGPENKLSEPHGNEKKSIESSVLQDAKR